MIRGVHHVSMASNAPAKLAGYHRRVFGLDAPDAGLQSAVWAKHLGTAPAHALMQRSSNMYVALVPADCGGSDQTTEPGPLNGLGLRHICFQNRSIDALAVDIPREGGCLFAEPIDLGTGNQYAYARDPDHNIYEIEGLPYAHAAKAPWVGHAAIVVADLDEAIQFFQHSLGCELRHRMRIGPGVRSDHMTCYDGTILEGAWLYAGNILIELWQFISPASPQSADDATRQAVGFRHIAFETDDAHACAQQAEELGAQILTNTLEEDGILSIDVRSPQGVAIKFVQFAQQAEGWSIEKLSDPLVCARTDNWDASALAFGEVAE